MGDLISHQLLDLLVLLVGLDHFENMQVETVLHELDSSLIMRTCVSLSLGVSFGTVSLGFSLGAVSLGVNLTDSLEETGGFF